MKTVKISGVLVGLLVLLGVLATHPANAALTGCPKLISYQGRVTNGSGIPVADGSYPASFMLYNDSTLGVVLWSESSSISTTSGLFAYNLGSVTAIPDSVFSNNSVVFLDVTVNGQHQTPRTRLISSPYSLRTNSINGALSGEIKGNLTVNTGSGSATIYNYFGNGTGIDLTEENGIQHTIIEPDADGGGGYFAVYGGLGAGSVRIDGNHAGTGIPYVTMNGTSTITFDPGTTGNNSVQLPADAVSSSEILDEPGLVNNRSGAGIITLVHGASMVDLVTVTITTPAPGYITLDGTGSANLVGVAGPNGIDVQIDETAGGSVSGDYPQYIGTAAFPNTSNWWFPFHVTRTYFKAAGTYTFRLEAMQDPISSASGSALIDFPWLRAIYLPTSYGAVATVVSDGEKGQFESARAVTVPGGMEGKSTATTMYEADLRDLELKAVKAEAEAQKARAALAEAALRNQLRHRSSAVADK